MSDNMDVSVDTASVNQTASEWPAVSSDQGGGGNGVSSALTDDHHDWTSAFTGIDTRAELSGGSVPASASSDATPGGSLFSGIANAVGDASGSVISTAKNVVGDVGHTVADAASGVVETVETVAGDVGHAVSDAASGVVDTAGKVANDIGSGNFGDALGDAASGVVSTTGHVVSDVAHTVVDAGSGILSTAGKIVTDADQTITDVAVGAISATGKVVGDTAQAFVQAAGPNSTLGQAAGSVGNFSTSAVSGLVDTVNTVNDFNKGVVEGAVDGVEGLAKGVVSLGDSVGKEAFALATDEKTREQAAQAVLHGAEAVGNFAETAVTDPSKALGQVEDTAGSAVNTVENVATNVYKSYQAATAQGHGAEFIGKGVGQVGVLVAGAVLTDGASLAGEGAAVAGEGAMLATEGAEMLTEGANLARGAEVLEEGSTLARGAANALEEGGSVASRSTAVTEEAATAATESTTTVTAESTVSESAEAASGSTSSTARTAPEGGTTKTYRVEGKGNERVLIDEDGNVTIPEVMTQKGAERNLYLNFGDEARAQEFLEQRLAQFPDNQIKSFDVPNSFVDELRSEAVSEAKRAANPLKPVIADPTKAADQFGLPAEWIERLRQVIVQGSGLPRG